MHGAAIDISDVEHLGLDSQSLAGHIFWLCPLAPIELPSDVAKSLVKDMRLFQAESNAIKRDEIASRQLFVLRQRYTSKLHLHDVKEDISRGVIEVTPFAVCYGTLDSIRKCFHDSSNRAERDPAHRIRRPCVPCHHIGGLGSQLADHEADPD
jgi:hypothetical protein